MPKQLMDRHQASVCAERRWLSELADNHVQPVVQLTLASGSWTDLVPAGSASVSLSPRLCAPGYLASDLQRVSDLGARRRLRTSTTSALVAPCTVRATIGDWAFPAAAAPVWNICRRQYAHRRHCQFSAVGWRLNFLPGLTAALTNKLTALLRDPTRPITVTCPCSPRTYATLK